jgi:Putative MetA-pathway of phenol degradation
MNYKNFASGMIFLFAAIFTHAQDPNNIEIDRLGVTISPLTMEKGSLQAEIGGSFWSKESETVYSIYLETITQADCMLLMNNPVIVLRYGLLSIVELRLGTAFNHETHTYSYDKTVLNFPGFSDDFAWGPLVAGVKVRFLNGKGVVPASAVLINISIPAGDFYLHTDYVSPEVKLAFRNVLSKKTYLSYNLGYGWRLNEGSTKTYGTYAASLSADLTGRIRAYAETYGYLADGRTPDLRLGTGFSFLFAENVKADFSGGLGISHNSPDFSLGMGVSLRLP